MSEHEKFQNWVRSLDRSHLLRAMEFSFQTDDSSNSSSHEYDLLLEMIKLQPPPPTPIHPRAVWHKVSSAKGKTDGRNEAVRVLKSRIEKPRLFQLFPSSEAAASCCLPPALRGLLGASNGRRKRGNKTTTSAPSPVKYEVTARQFTTPWGDALNIGCTHEQRQADDNLVLYTCVDPGEHFLTFTATNSYKDILRMLQVASRGQFLSQPYAQTSKSSPSYCAPWLDPTARWFSLPMYLASRLEVSLWESFKRSNQYSSSNNNKRPWEELTETVAEEGLQMAIQNATKDVLLHELLREDKDTIPERLRDGYLLDLLESIDFWRLKRFQFNYDSGGHCSHRGAKRFLQSIYLTPIVELGSTTHRMRVSVRLYLQSEISRQMERNLVASLESSTVPNTRLNRRNNRKKKHRRGRKKQAPKKEEDAEHNNENDINTDAEETNAADFPMRLAFPENGTPFVERNRNIVLCLSTLNDIINDVFQRVGLEVSSDESDTSGTEKGFQMPKADGKPKNHSLPPVMSKRANVYSQQPSTENLQNAKQESNEEKKTGIATPTELPHARFSPPETNNEGDPPSATALVDTFPSQHCFPAGFFLRNDSNPWGFYNGTDGWGPNRFPQRDQSILAEFFLEQEVSRQERITTSSTAASLASSTDKNNEDTISISDKFFISLDNGSEAPASDIASTTIDAEEFPSLDIYQEEKSSSESKEELMPPTTVTVDEGPDLAEVEPELNDDNDDEEGGDEVKEDESVNPEKTIYPEAPATPSPRLSPILLSLDDLRDIREGTKSVGNAKEIVASLPAAAAAIAPASLPSSPVEPAKRRLVSSLSREDLRIKSFRDDHGFVQKKRRSATQATSGGSPSYRNVAAGSAKVPAVRSMSSGAFPKLTKDSKSAFFRQHTTETCARSENAAEFHDESQNSSGLASSYRNVAAKSVKSISGGSWKPARPMPRGAALSKQKSQGDLCARSETAMEGHEDFQNWNDSRRSNNDENPDNMTVGKDGSTTITSAMSAHRETEETSNLREERNTFRDMCLTLGAEVAKLKNQLASHQGATVYPPFDYTQGYMQPGLGAGSFDPECMPPFFQKGQALGAMSDAGIHRGEYESQVSEDDEQFGMLNYNENGRRLSSGATVAGSDHSIEPTSGNPALQGPVGLPAPISRDSHDAGAMSGLRTRLTEDILKFMASTEVQHRKLDSTRDAAVVRMTRLVNTLWPRAQVKVYGSHVTGLCLPSSDLDFVICLPAVHKRAPAVAPGVLEGRNAINESSQKLLARKLKGESWVDPRSMKLIERTVVPVIKAATKDTRARTIHLDISFDSPEHHGLEAVVMVKQIVEEFPMIRPLVLILKQFLLDRGLLTAYTGGLSSYCLFLMVARYLQEQPSYWGDCGSLLMGFLDFYGNCFDPRSTGISVGRRQYFTRPNYVAAQRQVVGQHMWAGVSPSPGVVPSPTSAGGAPDFYLRNSVNEKGSLDGVRGATGSPLMRPPRFQPGNTAATRFKRHMPAPAVRTPLETPMDHAMPFTFDPLFVDDPLSYGNNVGRNAFRIFQVQRAFSDAHRALVASLEWDIQSTNELHDSNDYPLLKSLLRSEDVLYEL